MKIRSIVMILVVAACCLVASIVFAAPAFSDAQKDALGPIIHDYIVSHPQVLVEASQALQMQQMDQMSKMGAQLAKKYTGSLFRTQDDIVLGNPKGKVTMVMFFDYQCIICRAMSSAVEQIIKDNPDLRVVYKDFPVHGENSILAAHAAYAALQQGKYAEFHNAIMDSQLPVTKDTINQFAKQVGLNMKKFNVDLKKYAKQSDQLMAANEQLAGNLQLMGTPTFVIARTDANADSNITLVPGRTTKEDLQNKIDAAR